MSTSPEHSRGPTGAPGEVEDSLASELLRGSWLVSDVEVPEAGEYVARRGHVGIRLKMLGLMVALNFLIIAGLASYFSTRQIAQLQAQLRERTAMYGRLAALQLRSAVAFNDRETAREVLGALAKDPLVAGVGVYTDEGARLYGEGQLSSSALAARQGFDHPRTFALPRRLLLAEPIVSLEGPRGTLILELSTERAMQASARVIRITLGIGAVALIFGTALAWWLAGSLARRIEDIAQLASAVARGDLKQEVDLGGPNDEILLLKRAFDTMMRRLRGLIQHIRERAREENRRLDNLVRQRTSELDRRNSDLQLVLDNIDQGLLTIDRDAQILGERSRATESWMGVIATGDALPTLFDRMSPGKGASFTLAWSQLKEGLMPAEVSLGQLPQRIVLGEQHISVDYKPFGSPENFERMLLVMSDVTAEVERDRNEREERDLLGVSTRLFQDRSGTLEFFAETRALLDHMALAVNLDESRRYLHTLKGNAGVFGLSNLAALCHQAESELESSPNVADQHARIERYWQRMIGKLEGLIGAPQGTSVRVEESDYLALLAALHANVDRSTLQRMLQAWRLEPLRSRLWRAAEQLSSLALRVDKGPVHVSVTAANVYLASDELSEFWAAFVHVVRNAVDHGLESPSERKRLGKGEVGRFDLRAGIERDQLFVELEDNGPGIDWAALRSRLRDSGLDEYDSSPQTAIFADGITTIDDATELSGRGVGLGAVKSACERRHGTASVESSLGLGTTFRFCWPRSELKSLVHIELTGS